MKVKTGAGYLIASSQGDSHFVVYDCAGDTAYIGTFRIIENEQAEMDAVSGTDGIDVTAAALGDDFPDGVFVAQDNRNLDPSDNQNFKLVPWEIIAAALGIE